MLATEKVRQVGELIAMCVGRTRAEAEDIAAECRGRFRGAAGRPRHAQARARRARRSCTSIGATTSFLETLVDVEYRGGARRADQGHARDFAPRGNAWRRSKAAAWSPIGTAAWTSSSSTPARQMPHIVRTGLAECLGLDARAGPRHLAGCRRRVRLQGHSAAGGCLPRRGSRCAAAIRCAGSRTGAST